MRHLMRGLLASAALALIVPALAQAHFTLMEPASWLVENRLGDPQKLGPCGGTPADAGMPTNAIRQVRGNPKLPVKLQETVFHSCHYPVLLARKLPAHVPAYPDRVPQ